MNLPPPPTPPLLLAEDEGRFILRKVIFFKVLIFLRLF
jgi:hypothetical protein